MLTAMAGSRHAVQNSAVEVEPLPDGICVSRLRTTASQQQSLQDLASTQGQHRRSDSRCQQRVLCQRICWLFKTSTLSYSSPRLQQCTSTTPASTPSLFTPTSRRAWSRSPCPTWCTRPTHQSLLCPILATRRPVQ